jgi:hypothetical protein
MFWKKRKKKNESEFACVECGQIHSGWPALAFSSPANYHELKEEERENIAEIDSDFCTITYPDQTDRFIRVSLTQLVNDAQEDLEYGLWVSLSEKSFENYRENYNNDNHITEYFGWLCSRIPEYENTQSIPTTVVTQAGNQRPIIYPHKDHDHPFVQDYYQGISSHEAQKRVDDMLADIA